LQCNCTYWTIVGNEIGEDFHGYKHNFRKNKKLVPNININLKKIKKYIKYIKNKHQKYII
jgi:hypothetical protein